MRKKSLLDQYGPVPAGMSKADVSAVLDFLYGAFDRQTARRVTIIHPYAETDENAADPPELTVFEFCRWLEAASAA
jgi:hypothetical protein